MKEMKCRVLLAYCLISANRDGSYLNRVEHWHRLKILMKHQNRFNGTLFKMIPLSGPPVKLLLPQITART